MADKTAAPSDPGFLATLIAALRNFGQSENLDARAAQGKAASQQVANELPSAVMPHEALRKQQEKQALMDALLRNAQ
jgi:hypothetical protein